MVCVWRIEVPPEFSGDPIEWPSFMTRFADTKKRCAYTVVKNLNRMTKCLKVEQLAVKGDLHKRNALSIVFATLRMLLGQPVVVYSALINSIKTEPDTKADDLESLLTFSMSVKTLRNALLA